MSAPILGIARIKVNGELLESMPGASMQMGGLVVKEVKVGHRPYGPVYEYRPGKLSCTIVAKEATPIEDIRKLFQGLILFEGDNSITYKCSNAYLMGDPKLKDGDGEIELEFEGDEWKRQ
jgi:hypothetical protein